MIFGELFYGAFLCLTLVIYWLVPFRLRMTVVAVSGLLFYCYYAGNSVILLASLTLVSWLLLFGRNTDTESSLAQHSEEPSEDENTSKSPVTPPSHRSIALVCILVFVLVLAYYKYGSFLQSIWTGREINRTVAPLAISFFIFEFIHVAYERLKGNIRRAPLSEYVAFIFFFPTMIAGPIKRYDQFDEQVQQARLTSNNMAEGVFRILIGLFKKMVLADNLNTIIQEIGTPEKTQNVLMLSAAIFLYGFRIYLDFSGYSDIAIGSARLFGIRVPENFLHPYRQSNISAFWRNWHRSLYTWLIDYVYIPLGGSRVRFVRNLANILIVMLVSGIWHGAAWNFILWGLWHGILLVIHKVYSDKIKDGLPTRLTQGRFSLAVSYLATMLAVWFGWLLFMWPLHYVNRYLGLLWTKLT